MLIEISYCASIKDKQEHRQRIRVCPLSTVLCRRHVQNDQARFSLWVLFCIQLCIQCQRNFCRNLLFFWRRMVQNVICRPGNRPIVTVIGTRDVRPKFRLFRSLRPVLPGLKALMDKANFGVYIDVYQNRCKLRFFVVENAVSPAVRYFAQSVSGSIRDRFSEPYRTSPPLRSRRNMRSR